MFVSGKEEMKFNLNIHVQADDKTTILACLIGRAATRNRLRGVGFIICYRYRTIRCG